MGVGMLRALWSIGIYRYLSLKLDYFIIVMTTVDCLGPAGVACDVLFILFNLHTPTHNNARVMNPTWGPKHTSFYADNSCLHLRSLPDLLSKFYKVHCLSLIYNKAMNKMIISHEFVFESIIIRLMSKTML